MMLIHKGEWMWLLKAICSPKYSLISLPFGIGYAVQYFLWCEGLKYISSASAVAIVQVKLFLDMTVAYLALSTKVSPTKFLLVASVFCCVITHTQTLDAGALSKDPAKGRFFFTLFSIETAFLYIWFPWAIPRYELSPIILAFVSSIQTGLICVLVFSVSIGIQHMGKSFITSDVLIFVAWVSIDAACFFCPIWVSPLFTTLCGALAIPLLYILEVIVFGTPFQIKGFLSVVAVATAVITVGLYQGECDARVAEEGNKQEEKKGMQRQVTTMSQASGTLGYGGGIASMSTFRCQ